MKLKSFDEVFSKDLRDPEFVREYLEAALEEDDMKSFLVALQNVIRATQEAKITTEISTIEQANFYKSFSESGNPQIATVDRILRQLGLRLSVTNLTLE
jgi:probable addiction module antidote protein